MRCIGDRHTAHEDAIKGFKTSDRGEANEAYEELVRRGYLIRKQTSYGEQVSLNVNFINDVKNLLNPSEHIIKDKPPLEDFLDPSYEKRPFHITEGDHTVKGVRAKYRYHTHLNDPSRIICYVVVEGEKKSAIEFGSFNNPESLLSKAVRRIDTKFKGQPFTKPDLYGLGKDIEGNRQPPKAIIDMLLHFGYIIQQGKRHYQRTTKKLPQAPLDLFRERAIASEIRPSKNGADKNNDS